MIKKIYILLIFSLIVSACKIEIKAEKETESGETEKININARLDSGKVIEIEKELIESFQIADHQKEEFEDLEITRKEKESLENFEITKNEKETIKEFAEAVEDAVCGKPECIPRIIASVKEGIYNSEIDIDFRCEAEANEEDGGFLCNKFAYSIDGSIPNFKDSEIQEGEEFNLNLSEEGTYTVKIYAKYGKGKILALATFNYTIDTTPSVTSINLSPGTYYSRQEVTLSCDSCEAIAFTLDGSDPTFDEEEAEGNENQQIVIGDSATIELNEQGEHQIRYFAKDSAGNIDEIKEANYQLLFRCSGSTISDTGYMPCDKSCGIGVNETGGRNNGRTACYCQNLFTWDKNEKICKESMIAKKPELNQLLLLLLL